MFLWVDKIRYFGIHFVWAKYFKCSLDRAKCSFHRAVNSVFGKIGRIASEESVLQLIKGKCLPTLLYGLEACPLKRADLRSLDFVINRLFMKLFRTNNMGTVRECQHFLTLICLVSQLSTEPPTLSQNLLQIVITCCYCN